MKYYTCENRCPDSLVEMARTTCTKFFFFISRNLEIFALFFVLLVIKTYIQVLLFVLALHIAM